MQDISTFNSNLGTAILLVGGAGAGKTSLGMSLFPNTWVNVTDLNFKSGLDYIKRKGTANVVGFDTPGIDDKGLPVPANLRMDRMIKQTDLAEKDPKIDALFFDSGTFMEDIFKARICGATTDEKVKLAGFDHWSAYLMAWKGFIMQLRMSGKKVIVSCHEAKELDESDKMYKYTIALDGQIRTKFPALFSDVWRCEVAENLGKYTWNVRVLGNARQEHLKNTYGFANADGTPCGVLTADELVKRVRAAK